MRKCPFFNEMANKYRTGQYTITELAKIYNVERGWLSKRLKREGAVVDENAKKAVECFTEGFVELNKVLTQDEMTIDTLGDDSETEMLPRRLTQEKAVELANTIIDIVADKNPQFAKGFQALSALMIKKSMEILRGDKITTSDIKNISDAMRNMDATMGVFPKAPQIAQQFNFGARGKNAGATSASGKVEFVVEIVGDEKQD